MTEVVAVFTRKDHFCITFSECLPNVTLWKSRVLQHPKGQDLSGWKEQDGFWSNFGGAIKKKKTCGLRERIVEVKQSEITSTFML